MSRFFRDAFESFQHETIKFVMGFILLLSSVSHSQTTIEVTHPDTGETYEIKIEKPDPKILNQWRPSQLTFKKIKELTETTACQVGQICRASVQEFPVSAAAFYGASFLVAARQSLTNPENDPIALHNFLIQNITDPVAHLSFLSFIAGNRGAGQVLDAIAVSRGWIRNQAQFESMLQFLQSRSDLLSGFSLSNLTNATPAQIQAYMNLRQELDMKWPQPAKSPVYDAGRLSVGMATGFVLSGVVADFLHDEYVSHCFLTPTYSFDRIQKETARMKMTPARACDLAWDRWVTTDKILDYMPEVVSALVTSAVLAKTLPFVNKGLTKAGMAVRGIRFFKAAGKFFPQSRMVLFVEHAYFFLEMQHWLNPYLKNPFEEHRKGKKAFESYTAIETAISRKNSLFDEKCWAAIQNRFPKDVLDQTPTSTVIEFAKQKLSECPNVPKTPLGLVRDFSATQDSWRGFWFQKSAHKLANWQREMLSLQSTEADARKIYGEIVSFLRANPKKDIKELMAILNKYDLDRYDESYPSVYKFIRFENRGEFFLNSMVCGPMHPNNSLIKAPFMPMYFIPPSFVSSEAQAVCNSLPKNQIRAEAASLWYDWKGGVRIIQGKSYDNLLEILINHLRKEFKDDKSVEAYWNAYVRPVVEKKIVELLQEYKIIQGEIKKDMTNSESKKIGNMEIPYGILPHMEWQANKYLVWLEQTLEIKLTENELNLMNSMLAAAKDENQLEVLKSSLAAAGLNDVVKLALQNIQDERIQRYLLLTLSSEYLVKNLEEKFKGQAPKFSGFQLEMGKSLFEAFTGILKSVAETQIYQIAVSI